MSNKEIQPELYDFNVIFTNGKKATFKSTRKFNETSLDVDPSNHPAWKTEGGNVIIEGNKTVEKFNKKYKFGSNN